MTSVERPKVFFCLLLGILQLRIEFIIKSISSPTSANCHEVKCNNDVKCCDIKYIKDVKCKKYHKVKCNIDIKCKMSWNVEFNKCVKLFFAVRYPPHN